MNVEHQTLNIECRYRFAHFFNKIETPKAYHNSTLDVHFDFLNLRLCVRHFYLRFLRDLRGLTDGIRIKD